LADSASEAGVSFGRFRAEYQLDDLKAVTNANCSVDSLTQWAERWYRL
jgi:hypothetical protein